MDQSAASSGQRRTWRQRIGFLLGPLLVAALLVMGPPSSVGPVVAEATNGAASAQSAWMVLCLVVLMAVWWVSEALPIPVTSLLPLVVLPMAGVMSIGEAAPPYMHPVVILLMGGFMFAKAIERWNLHTRIALNVVVRAGNSPARIIAGFMGAAALLSMWISNTATSIMMMPIAISVAAAIVGDANTKGPFTYALLLGIAYACSIGGLGTLVGTPTNLIVAGYLNREAGFDISFAQWMMFGVPTVIVMVPLAWLVLTKIAFRLPKGEGGGASSVIRERLAALGPLRVVEARTLIVFSVIAFLWIFRRPLQGIEVAGLTPLAGLTDHVIAIIGVFLVFIVPAGKAAGRGTALLDWRSAESIPWGVVLLFGGGMALASAIQATGLGAWIGTELSFVETLPIIAMILVVTTVVIFATEVTSNIATASALMPVLGAVALQTSIPIELMAAPLALAASCAFMLPMATGPNAVVFATGQVSLPIMARTGFMLNLLAIVVITGIAYGLAPLVFRN